MKRHQREIIEFAERLGWELLRTTAHEAALLRHKTTGERVTVSATPRDRARATANARAELRRKARAR